MSEPEILDTTLRDGGYAVGFQLTVEDACVLASTLDRAGIPFLEVGHGWGVDVRRQLPYESLSPDEALPPFDELAYFASVRAVVRRAKLGAPLFVSSPGVDVDSLRILTETKCDFVRVLVDVTAMDAPKTRRIVRAAVSAGLCVSVNFLKTYAFDVAAVVEASAKAVELGASWIYVVDSAGGMMPTEVAAYVQAAGATGKVRVGFHGHDNLGFAMANCAAAVEAGATLVDGSLQGLGRATGNAPTERLLVWLQSKQGAAQAIDAASVFAAGRTVVRPWLEPGFDPTHALSGAARLHSDWLPRIATIAARHCVKVDEVLVSLGHAALAEGQLGTLRDDLVETTAAKIAASRVSRPVLTSRTPAPPVLVCADSRAAIALLRIARRRDHQKVALALVPRNSWIAASPHVSTRGEWSVAWVPVAAGDRIPEPPPWLDHVLVAEEVSDSAPTASTFSLRRALALALASTLAWTKVHLACEDAATKSAIEDAVVGLLLVDEESADLLVVQGSSGRQALRRLAVRTSGTSRHPPRIIVVGPLADMLPSELSAAVELFVPDPTVFALAMTLPSIARLRMSAELSGPLDIFVDDETTLLVERRPVSHVAWLDGAQTAASVPDRISQAAYVQALGAIQR